MSRGTKSTAAAILIPLTAFGVWTMASADRDTSQTDAVPVSAPSRPLAAPLTPSWGEGDHKAMRAANVACEAITDDYTYEACVVGDFVLTSGKLLTSDGYVYNDRGAVVLTEGS